MRWICVAMLAIATTASADTALEAEFKQLLQKGLDSFRLGKLEDARVHLVRARSIDRQLGGRTGEPYRYLAAVASAQLEWEACISYAREALQVEPKAQQVAETRKLHASCRTSAGRPGYPGLLGDGAALAVTSNVPATVKVRGLVFGGTPIAPRSVVPGRIAIDVEKAGYISVHLDVDALPGIVTDVDIQLELGEEKLAVPIAKKVGWVTLPIDLAFETVLVDGVAVKVPPDRKIELGPGMHVVEIRASGRDPWRRQIAITADNTTPLAPAFVESLPRTKRARMGYALVTAGATFSAVGIFGFYTSRGAANEARRIAAREIARPIGDTTPPIHTRADFEDARSRAKKWALISNLAHAVGLAAGGVGLYFIITGRKPADDEVPAVVVAPVEGGGAMLSKAIVW